MCFDKDASLERGFFERGAYWREELIGQRGSSEKGAYRRKRLFFVGGLFWERGLLERGAYWKEGLFWREAFLGEGLFWERGSLERRASQVGSVYGTSSWYGVLQCTLTSRE